MKYLEVENLIVDNYYTCVFYDSSDLIVLKYIGNGNFVDQDNFISSIHGDIRYVLYKE